MKRKIKYIIGMIWWQLGRRRLNGDCLRGLEKTNKLSLYCSPFVKLGLSWNYGKYKMQRVDKLIQENLFIRNL